MATREELLTEVYEQAVYNEIPSLSVEESRNEHDDAS